VAGSLTLRVTRRSASAAETRDGETVVVVRPSRLRVVERSSGGFERKRICQLLLDAEKPSSDFLWALNIFYK
jgi:hypothetical protein